MSAGSLQQEILQNLRTEQPVSEITQPWPLSLYPCAMWLCWSSRSEDEKATELCGVKPVK